MGWPVGKCVYCGDRTGLDAWQLREMPRDMAYCERGKKLGWFPNLLSKMFGVGINCWSGEYK